MVVLTAESIAKIYGDRTLFEGVSFGIHDADKIGLIGVNGAGKSTLVKMLLGQVEPDAGQISTNNNATFEYLSQAFEFDPEKSAMEHVLEEGPEAFKTLLAYEAACRALETNPEDTEALEQVSELSHKMDQTGGWQIESEARTILGALGLERIHAPIGQLSGGQQKRVALARALIRPCDLLILDEPTNHLDVQTIEWLERTLIARRGALLLITHDRYFLERVTHVIFELSDQTVYRHEGAYSAFLDSRAARQANQASRESKRVQLAKKELAWLRAGVKARTTKSKHRMDKAHEILDARYGPEKTDQVKLETLHTRLGKKIVELESVSKSHGSLPILKDFSYTFSRQERLGIVGPNGIGKSTLLNLIAGRITPDSGTLEVGETVVVGYYDQQSEELDESMRVHDYIVDQAGNRFETADGSLSASQMLERFLFSRQRQWAPIEKLSGGERRRLYLLRILLKQPNVLLLDEPTNDLDVETLSVLEDYLDNFAGVLVVVSHDRYFLDRCADHLLIFDEHCSLDEFPGNYSQWLEHRREQDAMQPAASKPSAPKPTLAPKPPPPAAAKLTYKEQQELGQLPAQIGALEARIQSVQDKMAQCHDDYVKLGELTASHTALSQELEGVMERWMELEEKQS